MSPQFLLTHIFFLNLRFHLSILVLWGWGEDVGVGEGVCMHTRVPVPCVYECHQCQLIQARYYQLKDPLPLPSCLRNRAPKVTKAPLRRFRVTGIIRMPRNTHCPESVASSYLLQTPPWLPTFEHPGNSNYL